MKKYLGKRCMTGKGSLSLVISLLIVCNLFACVVGLLAGAVEESSIEIDGTVAVSCASEKQAISAPLYMNIPVKVTGAPQPVTLFIPMPEVELPDGTRRSFFRFDDRPNGPNGNVNAQTGGNVRVEEAVPGGVKVTFKNLRDGEQFVISLVFSPNQDAAEYIQDGQVLWPGGVITYSTADRENISFAEMRVVRLGSDDGPGGTEKPLDSGATAPPVVNPTLTYVNGGQKYEVEGIRYHAEHIVMTPEEVGFTPPDGPGWVFDHWGINPQDDGDWYRPGDMIVAGHNSLVLYAFWVCERVFAFSSAEHDWSVGVSEEALYIMPWPEEIGCPEALPGRVFYAWNTEEDGTGTYYFAGRQIEEFLPDTVFFAIYHSTLCRVVYHANGGDGHVKEQEVAYGGSVTLSDGADFAYPGKRLIGWAAETGGDKAYGPGEWISSLTSDLELYAVWADREKPEEPAEPPPTPRRFMVTYDKNTTDSVTGSLPVNGLRYESGAWVPVSANTLTRAGYTLRGWALEKANGRPVNGFAIAGNTTLYAVWEPLAYRLRIVERIELEVNDRYPSVASARLTEARLLDKLEAATLLNGAVVPHALPVTLVVDGYDEKLFDTVSDGALALTITASWANGVTDSQEVLAEIVDKKKPVITTPQKIDHVEGTARPSDWSSLIEWLDVAAYDNYDGEITDRLELLCLNPDEGETMGFESIKWDTAGCYPVLFNVSDLSGNRAWQRVCLIVVSSPAYVPRFGQTGLRASVPVEERL